mgnify:FL=1
MSALTTARPPSCSSSPSWEVAAHKERVGLERGMREWMLVEFNGRAAIYWITPKAAHTLIVRLFRKKPWSTISTHPGHAGFGGVGWMGELNGSISRRGAAKELHQARRRQPLEFTFVREPLQQLISSAAQLHNCIKVVNCFKNWKSESDGGSQESCAAITAEFERHMDSAPRVLRLMNMSIGREAPRCNAACANFSGSGWEQRKESLRRCARHIWPQTAGYGFDDQGASRLQFVGRIERFREDWERLLTVLGDDANHTAFRKVVTRKVNKRPHPAALGQGGSEWSKLRQEPLVRTWLHSMVKVAPRQCSSSAPGPPQSAPGGPGQLGTPRKRPTHWAPSRCLRGARASRRASKAADFTAFDHPGSSTTTRASTTRGRRILSRSLRSSTGRRSN